MLFGKLHNCLCLDRGGYFAVNAQQVWNRFWRPAAKTTFGGDAKHWSVAYSSCYALLCSLDAIAEMHQSQVEFCLRVEF